MPAPIRERLPDILLHTLFFVSGVAAVIYQLLWQRALQLVYGTHIESITIVITSFMLGLGLGSLLGGWFASRVRTSLPIVFAVIECSIAAYGFLSISLLRRVGEATADAPTVVVFVLVLALLVTPTILMGATLPILTVHRTERTGSVGSSLGWLYAVNTLGSAFGALLLVTVVAGAFGLRESVKLAALLNIGVGGVAWLSRSLWMPR